MSLTGEMKNKRYGAWAGNVTAKKGMGLGACIANNTPRKSKNIRPLLPGQSPPNNRGA